MTLTHLNNAGAANMVDVSAKKNVKRTAKARGIIRLSKQTLKLIREGLMKKGDVLATARIAGISAAKKTSEMIPLCHNIPIEKVNVDLKLLDNGIEIESFAVCTGKTGIEMEALTAVAAAALTIYDMCKAVDYNMLIENISLIEKTKSEK